MPKKAVKVNNVVFASRSEIAHALGGCAMIVTDRNVKGLYGEIMPNAFAIPAGEKSKCKEVLFDILSEMSKRGLDRGDRIAAVGGGVVSDITGLAASLYMRGIEYINVPTTVLGAVDAGIGGKTAIDFDGRKNLVGSFYMPKTVYIDFSFAASLPRRELMCGLGEIFKTCLLTRKTYDLLVSKFDVAAELRLDVLEELARACVAVKCEVTERDFRESGLRRVLNVGHTVGHALESANKNDKSHGEYVLTGILTECAMCGELVKSEYRAELEEMLLRLVKFPRTSAGGVLKYALGDKKNTNGEIEIMLPVAAGEVACVRLTADDFVERYNLAVRGGRGGNE